MIFYPQPIKDGLIVVSCDFWMESPARGIKLVGFPQPKSMHGSSLSFLDMFTLRGSRAY